MKRLLLVFAFLLTLSFASSAEAGWRRYYAGYWGAPYGVYYAPPVVVARPYVAPYPVYRPVYVAPAYPVYSYPAYPVYRYW
ncbi:MAG: hypothetical protein JNG90_08575 [Planctomycetaceae bacterium]|nr:hypothetical protein [Planctomycetaceae bacterium]